jgi:hypothetical protein
MQNINEFPPELLGYIFEYTLNREKIDSSLNLVCKLWNNILQNHPLQKHVVLLQKLHETKSSGCYNFNIIHDIAVLYKNMLKNNLYKCLGQLSPRNAIYPYYIKKLIDINIDGHIKINIGKKYMSSLAKFTKKPYKNIFMVNIFSNSYTTVFENNGKIIKEGNLVESKIVGLCISDLDYRELHSILFHFYKNL